jgi:hypothetical protein
MLQQKNLVLVVVLFQYTDVENAVGNLVKISPSTYGFIFNQTDPLDKFLQMTMYI